MSWKLLYSPEAARAIRKLDPPVRRRVRAALETLAEDPWRGKPLQLTLQGLRSWRTGDYRIVYRVEAERVVVMILAVGHRREVYDRLRRRLR